MSQPDDRRPAWGAPLAVLAVVAGIVVVWFVGPRLPHRDDAGAAPSAPTTTFAPASTTSSTPAPPGFEPAPGWEDLGFFPKPRYFAVTADTGTELIVFGGGSNRSAPPSSLTSGSRWDGVAIDLDTNAMRELPPPPMCNQGAPVGVWTGSGLVVWSATALPDECAPGAAYSPETDQWRVLDSDFFKRAGSQVVWTGEELISTKGLAYRFDTGETRQVPSIEDSPMYTSEFETSLPTITWSGSQVLALGSEGVIRLDPATDMISDGPSPPISKTGRVSVWTGRGLLALGLGSRAVMFDPEDDQWHQATGVPVLYGGCPPVATTDEGLSVINLCTGIAVWDGSGDWKLLPLPGFDYLPTGSLVVAGGDLFQIGSRVLRYRLPERVDGVLPQPPFFPVGSLYLYVPEGWQVVRSFVDPDNPEPEARETVGVEVEAPEGATCRVEATFPGVNPYVPVFTHTAMLMRDRDGVEIPVGEVASDDEGLAHVVIDGGWDIIDVVCSELTDAQTVAARLWSPQITEGPFPPGTEEDTTCYVQPQVAAQPGDDSTVIVVQLRLLNPAPCAVEGPLSLQVVSVGFGPSPPEMPPDVELGQTLSPDQPYLIARYELRNWCSDTPVAANVAVANRFRATATDITAPCLDEGQSPTIELDGWEGPLATPKPQP
ncbi:MAG: hypothetical protein WAM81_04155 [Acidimicrobiia bacterium]